MQEFLDKFFIKESMSPCVVPTILNPKKDGGWIMCTDLREINKITIRYIFPSPCIVDLIYCLSGARYFSKLDLTSFYYQTRIHEEGILKIYVCTHEGLYEFHVMPFGLSNAPTTF